MNLLENFTDGELHELRLHVGDWVYCARSAYIRRHDLSAWDVLYDFEDLQRDVNNEQNYRRALVAIGFAA